MAQIHTLAVRQNFGGRFAWEQGMRFVCESCGKKYSSAGELKPGAVYRHKCKCGTIIVVKGPPREGEGASPTPPPVLTATPTPAPLPATAPASSAPYDSADGADFMAAGGDLDADAPTVKRQIAAQDVGYYEPDAPTVRMKRPGPPAEAEAPVEIELSIEVPAEAPPAGTPDAAASEAAERDLAALFAQGQPTPPPVEAAPLADEPLVDEPLMDASDLLVPIETEAADEPLVEAAAAPPPPKPRLDESIFEDVLHHDPVEAPRAEVAAASPKPTATVGRIVLAAAPEERVDPPAPPAKVEPAKPKRARRVSFGSVAALFVVALGFLAAGAYVHYLVGAGPEQRVVVVQVPVPAAAPAPAAQPAGPAAETAQEPPAAPPRVAATASQEPAPKPPAQVAKAKTETADGAPAKDSRPRVRPVKPPPEGWGDQGSGAGDARPGPASPVRQGAVASATAPPPPEAPAAAADGGTGEQQQ